MKKYIVSLYDASEDKVEMVVDIETKEDMTLEEIEATYDAIREEWYDEKDAPCLFEYLQERLREKGIDMDEIQIDANFNF